MAVAVALWGREDGVVWRPVLYAVCAREDARTAFYAERFCLASASARICHSTRSTIGGGGGGCNKFVPVLVGNGTKIASTGDI